MSIVIDMDMPKYCNECYFCTDSFGECDLKHEDIPNYEFWSENNEKPEWCPLKSVDDVLDKMRTEIEGVYNDRPRGYNHSQRTELFYEVMKIINKYIESEG